MKSTKGYKLKEDETAKGWLKAFCSQLNKATEGVPYSFREWSYGCCIDTRPQGKRYQVSIEYKPPRWKSDGDISSVNVRCDEIYPHHPRLNRRFTVKPDGSVNIVKLHQCVQERIGLIEEYAQRQKANAESYRERKGLLEAALKGSGIEAKHYSDNSGFRLEGKGIDVSGSLGMKDVTLSVGKLYVRFERLPAFFEAWRQLEAAIGGDDDDN